jgi:hypothetical protein
VTTRQPQGRSTTQADCRWHGRGQGFESPKLHQSSLHQEQHHWPYGADHLATPPPTNNSESWFSLCCQAAARSAPRSRPTKPVRSSAPFAPRRFAPTSPWPTPTTSPPAQRLVRTFRTPSSRRKRRPCDACPRCAAGRAAQISLDRCARQYPFAPYTASDRGVAQRDALTLA